MAGLTEIITDPLFRLPFVTGLLLAVVLPPLGSLLMLREEWLAALGLAHIAAAGALLGLAAGLPAVIGGTAGALAGGAAKSASRARGNAAYAFMILAGWTAMLLVASNTAMGDSLGHALIDGQLYFAGAPDLTAAVTLALVAAAALPRLSHRLLRARFFPRFEQANALPAWRWHLGLDLLAAAGMAGATATLG
jgi:zinc transport system permease protein